MTPDSPLPRSERARVTLDELGAMFVCRAADGVRTRHEGLSGADGLQFGCPQCYVQNGRTLEGGHVVTCWFEDRVPHDAQPGPGRWQPQGSGLADLSFVASRRTMSSSVRQMGGCNFHGHLIRGAFVLR